jgi:hypothetical protein
VEWPLSCKTSADGTYTFCQPAFAEPISQVDVLHIHEVALVEAADLVEGGTAQQQT